ncbi:MAG: hypothetical protein RL481_2232 [Pseudomonadota bacterium]
MALTPTEKPVDKDRAASDEAFLREVDDAVRASDLENFWTRYGRWLVAAIVAGLLAFGGYIYWSNQKQAAADAAGEKFLGAIEKLDGNDEKGGLADLATLAKAEQPAYRAMAQITIANIAAKNGNVKKAVADYGKVAADDSLPQPFRDMALIRQTAAEFDALPPQKIVDRLKPLAKPGNPWFGSAGEMTAIAYMKMGKDNLAGPIFAQIAKQEGLPETLRSRATQMAGSLGVDAVQLDEKQGGASAKADADKGNDK